MIIVIYKNTDTPSGNTITAFRIDKLINLEMGEEDIMHQHPGLVPDRIYQGEAECSDMLREIIPGNEDIEYIDPKLYIAKSACHLVYALLISFTRLSDAMFNISTVY
jgi:hypothetical protein